jgi:ribonuclease Z
MQLRKNKIKFGRINHIFISHIHGDHFYGLFGLLSSFNLLDRDKDLHIYAHKELQKGIKYIIRNYEGHFSYNIHFHEINKEKEQKIFDDERVEVYSFPVKHKIPTTGFLFREKPRLPNIRKEYVKKYNIPVIDIQRIKEGGDYKAPGGQIIPHKTLTLPPYKPRSYAFCTDTAYNEDIIPYIKNADLLYHEATFKDEHHDQAVETHHSTARQAATIARKANVKQLIIGHYSARYKEIDELTEEARSVFENTLPAEDGMHYKIEPTRITRE